MLPRKRRRLGRLRLCNVLQSLDFKTMDKTSWAFSNKASNIRELRLRKTKYRAGNVPRSASYEMEVYLPIIVAQTPLVYDT